MIEFSYIGDIKADVHSLLTAKNKEKTVHHVKAVAEMNIKIAAQYSLDAHICEISGYLHDISAVISPAEMMEYALKNNLYIDAAEKAYPFLLHQRISAVIAQEDFGVTDERILSAVGHHTTLKANPSEYDMALFVADKLAWDQKGDPPFYIAVNNALNHSLEAASLAYMDYITENNMIKHPHKWFIEGADYLRAKVQP
ncbi:MAG: HD domain-containing protein [Defluviitaleaceae bacterium]|nr:HD domain-containing protein [Defluviitaleaceae bacterium]